MYRSEALAALFLAQAAVQKAKDALYWATLDLQDAECDHPDTIGSECTHCHVFYISEESIQTWDDFRVLTNDVQDLQREGFPCLAPWGSEYYYFPHSRPRST